MSAERLQYVRESLQTDREGDRIGLKKCAPAADAVLWTCLWIAYFQARPMRVRKFRLKFRLYKQCRMDAEDQ